MNPSRKRKIRLIACLGAAVVLASALVYTSFTAASPAVTPSQLVAIAKPGQSYQLTGTVVDAVRHGDATDFHVTDRAGGRTSVAVAYTGAVPDAFKPGREVIVQVHAQATGSGFVGANGSLITKCPSKFTASKTGSKPY